MTDLTASAESLLREIATELVSLPLDDRSRPLHLRVLALKQAATAIGNAPPAAVEAVLDELRVLRAQVLEIRRSSGVRLSPFRRIPRRTLKIG